MAETESHLTVDQRARIIDTCMNRIGRKNVNNDDILVIVTAYSDADLMRLFDLVLEVEGRSTHWEIMSVVLDEDLPLLRSIHNNLYALTQRRITVEEMARMIHGLRYAKVMEETDEDCLHMESHIEIARSTFRDNNQIPYQQDDVLIQAVHEYPDRLDDIRRYRMERGYDSEGLRLFLSSASRALAEGTL